MSLPHPAVTADALVSAISFGAGMDKCSCVFSAIMVDVHRMTAEQAA